QVQPEAVTLTGPLALQQVVVTGKYADGSVRDLTPFCAMSSEPADVMAIDAGGMLTPKRNGAATLVVKAGGQTARVAVTVKDFDQPQPISFRHDFIAVLNVAGCNPGACHATPTAKNGFNPSIPPINPPPTHLPRHPPSF